MQAANLCQQTAFELCCVTDCASQRQPNSSIFCQMALGYHVLKEVLNGSCCQILSSEILFSYISMLFLSYTPLQCLFGLSLPMYLLSFVNLSLCASSHRRNVTQVSWFSMVCYIWHCANVTQTLCYVLSTIENHFNGNVRH